MSGSALPERPPGRLAPQEVLITLLGNELLHHEHQQVWAGGLVHTLAELGFSTSASRAAIARIVKRGLLDRSYRGREAFYTLSERATRRLLVDERRILEFTNSDSSGTWTMVNSTVPGAQRALRDRLRRRLTFLGYGSPNDGSWIAPGDRVADTEAALRDLELSGRVDMFVGRPAISTDISSLIDRAWPELDSLGLRYMRFVDRWSGEPPTAARSASPAAGSPPSPTVERLLLMHEWREFPLTDPGLADLYLPWADHRRAARDLFQLRWHQLAEPAHREFAEVARFEPQPTAPHH